MGYYRQRALQNLLSVWRLATAFAEIAAHRRSPADLPASQFLVGLLLAIYLVLELATLQLLDLLTGPAALLIFVDAAFFLAYIFVALQIFGRQGRFLQTAAALLGTSMLIDVIRLPVLAWAGVPDAAVESLTPRAAARSDATDLVGRHRELRGRSRALAPLPDGLALRDTVRHRVTRH